MVVVDVLFFMLSIFNRTSRADAEVFSNFSSPPATCGADNSR